MATAALLGPVAKHRVTDSNPPRRGQGLDIERCAALHNTLVLYGWVCSGKKIPDMQRKSWWSRYGTASLERILRPEMTKYLSKIFDIPDHNFFYHISGLAKPVDMLQLGDVLEEPDHDTGTAEKYRFLVLYRTSKGLATHPAGIVYDQQAAVALLMPTYHHIYNLEDRSLPWQPLEVILDAYLEMIEGEKALAVMDSFGDQSTEASTSASNPETMPTFGYAQWDKTRPWLMQPYTHRDLLDCIDVWKQLVEELEKRASMKREGPAMPIASNSTLNAAGITQGFAHQLLRHAQQSNITFFAPGIRLPKTEEFVYQPFRQILEQYPKETKHMKMPFLFLRCPGEVSAKDAKFRWPFSKVEKVPCGLYLDAFPNAQNPFEDACRLVLPIRLGGGRYARTSDFRPIRRSHADLYQVDYNPFVIRHGPKLVGILQNWLENVRSGHWQVNSKGVEGGVGMWRMADTREDWWRYQVSSRHLYS